MSSAILYVAIVAIWIGVLVPRWLRHDNTRDGHTGLRRFSRHKDTRESVDWDSDAEPGAVPGPGTPGHVRDAAGPGGPGGGPGGPGESFGAYLGAPVAEADVAPSYGPATSHGPATSYEPATEVPPVPSYGWSAEEYLRRERASQRGDAQRHDGEWHDAQRHDAQRGDAQRYDAQRHAGGSSPARGGEPAPPGEPRPGADGSRPRGPRHSEPSAPRSSEDGAPRTGERPAPLYGQHQARMMMARRRMLMMLVVLSVAAVGLAYLHLAASWVIIPPVVMLLGYLLLLREAARADAELRERRAAERAAAMARRAREQATEATPDTGAGAGAGVTPTGDGFAPVWPAHEPLPHADVIDISARVGDQLYDQYADAKLRAVGD